MAQSEPPSQPGLPLIGNAHRIARDPLTFREELVDEQVDLVKTSVGRQPTYMVCHPDYVEEVFVTDSQNYVKPELMRTQLDGVFGDGLLLSDGELWTREKELVQPSFYRDAVANYSDAIRDVTTRRLGDWSDDTVVNVEHEMKVLAFEILMESLFGSSVSYEAWDLETHVEAVAERYKVDNLSFYLPPWVPTSVNRRYTAALDVLDELVETVLRERRTATDSRDDLLGAMLQARADPDHPMDDDLLRDEILTIVLGGTDPVALSMTYAIYLLDQHPSARRKLEAEVDEVLGGDDPTFADLAALEYTERVVKESMRLYPPVWQQARQPVTDVTIGPYEIPEGVIVDVSPWGVHKDSRWWDEPDAFDPDRFSEQRAADRPDYAYFPFSAGRRQCVGKRLAMVEAQFILAMLTQRYRLELTPDESLDLSVATHISPEGGLDMQVSER